MNKKHSDLDEIYKDDRFDEAEYNRNKFYREGPGVKLEPLKKPGDPPKEYKLEEWFRHQIDIRIRRYEGNVAKVARSFGVTPAMIHGRLEQMGIDVDALRWARRVRREDRIEREKAKRKRNQEILDKEISYDIIFR